MQSASGPLAAAIEAAARQPKQTVGVDWDSTGDFATELGTLTPNVQRVTVDRSLNGPLPEGTTLLAGYGTAEATVEIGQGAAGHAAWEWSAYNADSPLATKIRLGREVDVQLGMETAGGPELLPAFRGSLHEVDVRPGARSVALTVRDFSERMGKVTLPAFPADDLVAAEFRPKRPGLDGQWVMDYVLRSQGVYASPPQRPDCRFLATLHGSAWPEKGTLERAAGIRSAGPVTFTADGPFGEAWAQTAVSTSLAYSPSSDLSLGDGRDLLIEGWFWVRDDTEPLVEVTNSTTFYGAYLLVEGGNLCLRAYRSPGNDTTAVGPAFPAETWTYAAVHVRFVQGGMNLHWRVGGTSLSSAHATADVNVVPGIALDRVRLGTTDATLTPFVRMESVQVTVEPYSGDWNDTFTPSAVLDRSLNTLSGIPAVEDEDAWQVVQDLAQAEMGVAFFDETGIFRFRNRNWRDTGDSAGSVRTLTASGSIKDLGSVESRDTVRNIITVRSQPVSITRPGRVWAASESILIPAHSSKTFTAELDGAGYNIDTTVTFSPLGGQEGSGYRAAEYPDGSGTVVSSLAFTVTVEGSTVRVTVLNPSGTDAYLVHPSGYPGAGSPALSLWGQVITTDPPEAERVLGALQQVWAVSGVVGVAPGETLSLWAPIGSDTHDNIDTTWTYSPPGGQEGSGYRACDTADGSGVALDNLDITAEVFASLTRIDVHNPNDTEHAYLINPSTSPNPGSPALSLWAQPATTVTSSNRTRLVSEARSDGSIRLYGEQPLDLPAGLWRQNSDSALALALFLLGELREPRPVLTNVTVMADPRLQLLDRVTIQDADGLALDGDFHLTRILTDLDGSGMTQSISARAATVWSRPVARYDVSGYDNAFYG